MILTALHVLAVASFAVSGAIAALAITLTIFEQRRAILQALLSARPFD